MEPRASTATQAPFHATLYISQTIENAECLDPKIKTLLLWMLRETENLTRAVAVTLTDESHGTALLKAMFTGVHDITDTHGSVRLNDLLHHTGAGMTMSALPGRYVQVYSFYRPFCPCSPGSSTVWIAPHMYGHEDSVTELELPDWATMTAEIMSTNEEEAEAFPS